MYTTRAVFRPDVHLTVHDWHTAIELSRFGARQPPRGTPQVPREHLREHLGAVLLPGLAFDEHGYRLGYGGGFYDRLLAGWLADGWQVPTVGVVTRALFVPQLPREPHDLPVQFLATELGVREV